MSKTYNAAIAQLLTVQSQHTEILNSHTQILNNHTTDLSQLTDVIDTNTSNALQLEFHVSQETIDRINQENLSVAQGDFNILEYETKEIPPEDIIQIIQYVYGMNLYSAHEMYEVVAHGKKPITIIPEVKKR
jgi:hypothetical protein